ncbi:MAG: T9SS type A sorting domain-containing protein [Bacteroidales bacterium]|nr:T9SS type A sorting domain-containing protein [Bacteroidales bacterium]
MRKCILVALCLITMTLHSQQWELSYEMPDGVSLVGGAGNSDGNYIVGYCDYNGSSGYTAAYVMFVDKNGNYHEKKLEFDGYKACFCSAICLDDGNAFVAGLKGGTYENHVYDTLWIAIMTPDLEIKEEHNYPRIEPYKTWTTDIYMDFNNQGDVVVLADVSKYEDLVMMTNGVYVALKCDVHGNLLNSKCFAEGNGPGGARPTGIIRVPNSDLMMILGKGFMFNNYHSVSYIDDELNKVAAYPLQMTESFWNHCDYWKDDEHFLMSSLSNYYGGGSLGYHASVFLVDKEGIYLDSLVLDRVDTADYTAQFGSMAYASDDAIYIATYWENGMNEMPNDAVIYLIDKELNLKGSKRLVFDDAKIRIKHCQTTSDGSCLVYGQCKKTNNEEIVCVWKLNQEDFIVPWQVNEPPKDSHPQAIYPNPASDYLNIRLDNIDNQGCVIAIRNLKGGKLFEQRFENNGFALTIDISMFEEGTYLYEVVSHGRLVNYGKFIKN